ncbi:hypothetical protein WM24_23705 [Burkholderia ubonensis]|nr:hypothetical protein WM24_23705 [Burkholderia ubonensis]
MRADAQRDIEIAAHVALERLIRGGDKDSLYVLASALDVARELALHDVGTDYLAKIERGMAAIVATKKRANLTGAWKFESGEAEAVSAAIAVHDAQLEVASRKLVVDTINKLTARIEAGEGETEFEVSLLEAA